MILKYLFISIYISLLSINKVKCAVGTDNNSYTLDTYDENNEFLKRYYLTFDYETLLFHDNSNLYKMYILPYLK